MTSSLLTFRDPPPPKSGRRGGRDYDAIIAQLQKRPGDWALLASGLQGKGTYSYIRNRMLRDGCEVTTRTTPGGLDVYARFPVAE